MKTYLFCFSDDFGTEEVVLAWLDHKAEVRNWITTGLPNLFVITSEDSTATLGNLVRAAFPKKTFMLAPIHKGTSDGYVAKAVWDHIATPTVSENWTRNHEDNDEIPF